MNIRRKIPLLLAALFAIPMTASAAIRQADTPPADDAAQQRVIIKLNADSPEDGIPVEWTGDGDVRIERMDVDEGPDGQRKIVVVAKTVDGAASNIESGGPWLGVQFGPVPKPLASHLRLDEGKGQMVLNVLEGSPADLAGFRQYDVITAIDGVESPADMGNFLDQIRQLEPNDITTFSLIRGGAATITTVTIGTRPDDLSANKYKYEDDTAHVAHGNVFRRGGIMRKDGQGNWVFDKLGDGATGFNWSGSLDIDDLDDAHFNAILKDVPFGLQRDVTVQSINGESVRIETDDDGSITVTKETKDGDNTTESTATYANEAEFEKADPDTFAKYHDRAAGIQSLRLSPAGVSAMPGGPHMFFLDKDVAGMGMGGAMFNLDELDGLDQQVEVMLDKLGTSGEFNIRIKDRIDDAMQRADDLGKRMGVFSTRIVTSDDAKSQMQAIVIENGKQTILKVGDDGKISLTIREGDDETVEAYDNIEQLKTARPELATRFDGLLRNLAPKTQDK
ncbi:MAG: PDZ domain-containing protein [Phycisphaerales bacterium]|nr:PDZ domain-containing protein [Phycisphaerales bacterium]MCB9855600.1 PDZ domain-containing protein [Phycisphaerales bacterium]MCB9864911.1 PDZ domain-containing protein [Phycisphaerales bacterium]